MVTILFYSCSLEVQQIQNLLQMEGTQDCDSFCKNESNVDYEASIYSSKLKAMSTIPDASNHILHIKDV